MRFKALALVSFAASLSGCGFILVEAPPTDHVSRAAFTCTEAKTLPVLDYVWGGLNALGAGIAISDDSVEDRETAIAVGLAWAVVSGIAGQQGMAKVAECRSAKEALARRGAPQGIQAAIAAREKEIAEAARKSHQVSGG